MTCTAGVAEFSECLCLDLTDSLSRDIEMRADGEVAVDAGVDTQWGALMADSSGQHQDEGSTFTKTGAGTLELTASGTTQ